MSKSTIPFHSHAGMGMTTPIPVERRVPVMALGMSLGAFFSITFILCVLFDLWFPEFAMNAVWSPLLPGFAWISWPSFVVGLIETFAYGWYVALVFGPLYNFFSSRTTAA